VSVETLAGMAGSFPFGYTNSTHTASGNPHIVRQAPLTMRG
jgi:hypothetical protein